MANSQYTSEAGNVYDFGKVHEIQLQSLHQNAIKWTQAHPEWGLTWMTDGSEEANKNNKEANEVVEAACEYAYEEGQRKPETSQPKEIEVNPSSAATSTTGSSDSTDSSSSTDSSDSTDSSSSTETQEQKSATDVAKENIQKQIDSQVSIPGLSLTDLLNKYIEKNPTIQATLKPYKEAYNLATSKEEREKAKKNLDKQIQSYVDQLTDQFQKEINTIKTNYNNIKTTISGMGDAITSFISGMAIPKVIVAGSAVGTANPATALIEAKQFKSTCSTLLSTVMTSALVMLTAAQAIGWEIPEAVTATLAGIATLAALINSIPV